VEEDGMDDDAFLRKVESEMLTDMKLRGINGIKKVFIREIKKNIFDETEGFKPQTEWMLDTEGVNLMEVMSHPGVDHTRTSSNHLIEVRVPGVCFVSQVTVLVI
jgi:DNA-directed RNA polymerase II subunit RPB1